MSSCNRARYRVRKRLWAAAVLAACSLPAMAADLTVSAAASLGEAFTALARSYESTHPDTHVVLNFAASGVLLSQLAQGAPVDVFASADEATMDKAQAQQLVDAASRLVFAGNTLVLVTPTQAAHVPQRLADLLGPGYARIAIGNIASVPAGRYAKEALDAAGIGVQLESRLIPAESVRQVLNYVARGEVDAGFVYATDAASDAEKVRVAMTLPTHTPIRYPVARVRNTVHATEADAFIAYLRSPEGNALLRRHGFSTP